MEPYRVLDLADEKGFLCGRILADLGADVIKVEPPGGDPVRRFGPFYGNKPDPNHSLPWWFYNVNKRGITLDIKTPRGRDIFRDLARRSHFVIESFPPGFMDGLELGYESLSIINPSIVFTSITPYGQNGPYREFKASDLTLMAMGGQVYVTGDPDRPPVRISFPQAYLHGGAEAAVASMIAHFHRSVTGQGQHVDISIQQSIIVLLPHAIPWLELRGVVLKRTGALRGGLAAKILMRQVWPCADGYVSFVMLGGAFGARNNRAIVDWMKGEGMADEFLLGFDWANYDLATATQEIQDRLEEPIGRFFLKHSKAELYEGALKRGIMLCPVATVKDLLENQQLRDRGFWVELEHPELNINARITYPGAFVQIAGHYCGPRQRAPLIGEHNRDIYGSEMGFPEKELEKLKHEGII
ncbi:MAG: CoA transferase [Chloroflexi bacterium]|nr:CoA transferase [Chloroflexota bacterium]